MESSPDAATRLQKTIENPLETLGSCAFPANPPKLSGSLSKKSNANRTEIDPNLPPKCKKSYAEMKKM